MVHDDRPSLKVSNWTACADDVAHIEVDIGTLIAAAQPDGMNTKAEKLCADKGVDHEGHPEIRFRISRA